jgi:hypothetical protein
VVVAAIIIIALTASVVTVVVVALVPRLLKLESFIIVLHLWHLMLVVPIIILIIALVLKHCFWSEHKLREPILQVWRDQHGPRLLDEVHVLRAVERIVFYCYGVALALEGLLNQRQELCSIT